MKTELQRPPPHRTHSALAIGGHPIHPALVHFPVAYLFGAFASDLAFWWTGDAFWARVSIWIIGIGFAIGLIAAAVGTLDFLLVKEIRRHVTSWSHFLAAIMMLSLTAANWWLRLPDPAQGLLPWGIFLSGLTALALAFAGWLGGKLVYEHNIGTADEA